MDPSNTELTRPYHWRANRSRNAMASRHRFQIATGYLRNSNQILSKLEDPVRPKRLPTMINSLFKRRPQWPKSFEKTIIDETF